MGGVIDVVAAVIAGPGNTYLLAQRPEGKVYAGYWEFPGGKVEPGETPVEAIKREIREELGIDILHADPWLMRRHDYEHARVRIRFFRVTRWRGEPRGLDGQRFAFQVAGSESVGPMLPANGPVLRALRLPIRYGISNAAQVGADVFLARLQQSLEDGLRLVQLRERQLPDDLLRRVAREALARCREHGAHLLISDDFSLADAIGAAGVHLPAARLRMLRERPSFALIGASAHNAEEIALAQAIGCDFAVLGPVMPTPTHVGVPGIGWHQFASLVAEAQLPVFALGGMHQSHLDVARTHGAHGLAMIRGAWQDPADAQVS
ncbi:MAG: Nudix family hydrolase [Burkholderiales bacterium]|nr:Nudix family hydrolase [Burkholderiales bacterium]